MKGTIAIAAALVAVLGGLGLGHAALRPDPNPPVIIGDDSVEARLDRMQEQLDAQHLEIIALRNKNNTLRAQVSNLIAINQHVSMVSLHGRPTVRFTGVNVQVVNGMGSTERANGTGNLILGYDRRRADDEWGGYMEECSFGEDRNNAPVHTEEACEAAGGIWALDFKTGSHYVVVGDKHNYSRYSGIVSGMGNTSSSRWASVTGGYGNRATGAGASVTGGRHGLAEGGLAVVSGGYYNSALGLDSMVSGGTYNIAVGVSAVVSGGGGNEASEMNATVSGGSGNKATAAGSTVAGGRLNVAGGHWSTVGGGNQRVTSRDYEWVAGEH